MARVMNSASHSQMPSFSRHGITFVAGGETRTVDLDAPVPVLRGDHLAVSLMDLWVATLLPGDFLDLSFEIVVQDAASPEGAARSLPPIDALRFARGHLALDSRGVSWDDDAADTHGASVVKIIVHGSPVEAVAPSAPMAPVAAAPRAASPSAMARLERMLPRGFAGTRYPSVSWRFKKDDPGAARAIMMR